MAKRNRILHVQDVNVAVFHFNNDDYISLTDIANAKEGASRAADIIKNWIRTRTTLEFLGVWEQLNNPSFKVVEFDHFKSLAGLPSFVLSPGNWIETTNAIGLVVKLGKYGGTYAHRDIAFEFGSAISPVFKLYLIKEYQRLKEVENNQYNLEWNVKRVLSKINYSIHTDAVKGYIIPHSPLPEAIKQLEYAEEADVLNLALFQCTAKQWREANPELAAKGMNIRDVASINELAVLSNLESANADMIRNAILRSERFQKLYKIAVYQLEILNKQDFVKSLKKTSDDIYLEGESPDQ